MKQEAILNPTPKQWISITMVCSSLQSTFCNDWLKMHANFAVHKNFCVSQESLPSGKHATLNFNQIGNF